MRLLVEGISHRYHGRLVLQDVSFAIEAGEIVCIIGPSGCGKSTLLRFLGGLEAPDAGVVWLEGEPPVASLNPLTFVFQDFALLPWRTVAENVELVLAHHPLSKAERRERDRSGPATSLTVSVTGRAGTTAAAGLGYGAGKSTESPSAADPACGASAGGPPRPRRPRFSTSAGPEPPAGEWARHRAPPHRRRERRRIRGGVASGQA